MGTGGRGGPSEASRANAAKARLSAAARSSSALYCNASTTVCGLATLIQFSSVHVRACDVTLVCVCFEGWRLPLHGS
jgi:hypothetical protein